MKNMTKEDVERICAERYRSGREEHGEEWVGERGSVESFAEQIDSFIYLSLERMALLLDVNGETDMLSPKGKRVLQVLDRLLVDGLDYINGVNLLIEMTEGDGNWQKLFP